MSTKTFSPFFVMLLSTKVTKRKLIVALWPLLPGDLNNVFILAKNRKSLHVNDNILIGFDFLQGIKIHN
jgi:hypothetical protein